MSPGMRLPHVAFIAPRIYPVLARDESLSFVGGAEVQQSLQLRWLQRAGWRVSVLTQDHGQPDWVDCEGIAVHRVPREAGRGVTGLRFLHPRLSDHLRLLRRVDPDLVYVQTASEEVAFAAAYALWHRKPFVFAAASDKDFDAGPLPGMPPQHVALYRWGLRMADAVIVQNTRQWADLARFHPRPGVLIPNGYDEAGARAASFDGPVLWAATVKPLKRPEHFVALARRCPHRRFVLVGGPAPTPEGPAWFDAMARQARGLANLTVAGHVPFDRVGTYFDGASVFINTSDYEGLPNTFLQAWLRGVPTLSFVRPESVPGVSGTWACDGLDGAGGMVAALEGLLSDRAAWTQASHRVRRHFQSHHTLNSAMHRLASVFQALCPPPRPGLPDRRERPADPAGDGVRP